MEFPCERRVHPVYVDKELCELLGAWEGKGLPRHLHNSSFEFRAVHLCSILREKEKKG